MYQHDPLQKNYMRLFVLRRSSRYEEPLQIQIRHYALNAKPKYTALSFVWGDGRDRVSIPVDGKLLSATRTLDVALRGVRLADQDQIMWADQISINQLDQVEKTQQVKHMCVIYPQATTVLCWLGEDEGTVREAFELLKKWAAARGKGRSKEKLRALVAAETMSQLSQARSGESPLEKLFSRSWWRRAWTLQEVCPSQTNRPILVCGQHRLTWYDFYYACYTMFHTLNWDERGNPLSSGILHVLPMLQTSWAHAETLRLSQLVPIVARREATVPVDKIFALLGMTKAAGLFYPEADYSLSADQVCTKYTRAIIQVDRCLDILFSVSQNRATDRVPTWAIKLDRMAGDSFRMDGHTRGERAGKRLFDATLNHPPIMDPSNGDFDRVLRLHGTPIDTISRLVPVRQALDVLAHGEQTWSAMLGGMANLCQRLGLASPYVGTGGGIVEALLDTLTLGSFYLTRRYRESVRPQNWDVLYASYQRYLSARKKGRLAGRASAINQQTLQSLAQQLCSFDGAAHDQSASRRALQRGNHSDAVAWLDQKCVADLSERIAAERDSRCMFLTARGYIGMGPRNAQAGDQVCLLFGGSTPFMLRPVRTNSGRAHQLVDEAYCEGFMLGEGLRAFVRNRALHPPPGGWTRYALV